MDAWAADSTGKTGVVLQPPPGVSVGVPLPLEKLVMAPDGLRSVTGLENSGGAPANNAAVENSIVRITASLRRPDLMKPWTKQAATDVLGTGIVVEGHRILTNAHVVAFAGQIQVQAYQSSDPVSASVVAIAPGIDLALLKLDDEKLFEAHAAMPRARVLPKAKDAVMAFGYSMGGTELSVTKGIVSRVEYSQYFSTVMGLRIQIDAAINPGNSGGPALCGDQMIGLVFSRAGNPVSGQTVQNVGYIIPNEEIDLFLEDIRDGHYDGKLSLYEDLQELENPALRKFLKLPDDVHGVVVDEPLSRDPNHPLKRWDVITKIGEYPIQNDGTVRAAGIPPVGFFYLVPRLARDGKVPLTVFRAGKTLVVDVPVSTRRPTVIPDEPGTYPSYFIFGPMCFSEATTQLAQLAVANPTMASYLSAAENPLITRRGDLPRFEGERLVVVSSPFFPHKLARGYTNPTGKVVESVNGQPVRNLQHFVQLVRDVKDEFVTIEFAGWGAKTIVLPKQEAIAATDEILADNGVRSAGSPDVLKIWNPVSYAAK